MDHPFRSAAFGGFNRQDVLDYFEKMAAENSKSQQELQSRLEEREGKLLQLSAQEQEREGQLSQCREELESLRRQLSEMKQALEESRAREESWRRRVEDLNRERDALKSQVTALEPDASAYRTIKNRTAGVELEAHCRAQSVLDEANAQARELRRNMEQWIGQVEREYSALRSQVEATVSHAADQLDKAEKSLGKLSVLLSDQEVSLESVIQAYDSTNPDKIPAPVPLKED